MLDRLRAFYLQSHHRRVLQMSDHPVQQVRRIMESVTQRGGNRGILCDLGAGSEPSVVKSLWKGRRIAIDIFPGPGLDLVGDGQALPFRDKSVDAILLMEVLEHVPNPLSLLQECFRILRPGGHMCLTAPQYHITHNYPADYYRYTRQGLEYLCGQAGLRVLDIQARGGPFLVIFHAIELNLPPRTRLAFVAATYGLFDWLDERLCNHGNREGIRDAIGWSVLAARP
jgi:SAM-dependent methyltransferase